MSYLYKNSKKTGSKFNVTHFSPDFFPTKLFEMKVFSFFIGLMVLLIFPPELAGQAHFVKQSDGLEMGQQEKKNHISVKKIYDVLQEKKATFKDFETLTPEINWDELVLPEEMNTRNQISLGSIMRNEWMSIGFKDLHFQTSEKNSILVTGIVNGRQPSECEFISYYFKHHWILDDDDRIIGFRE